jgi:cytochrome c-type biogenesis protein CcmH
MIARLVLAALIMLAAASGVRAFETDETLANPALEARVGDISRDLRCLVCQNQSIADSNADLAKDLRRLVRERIMAGDSDDEVIAFMIARYGDFVLLKPPLKPSTYALWFGPPVLFAIGVLVVVLYVRKLRARRLAIASGAEDDATAPLSDEERARLARLLDDDPDRA